MQKTNFVASTQSCNTFFCIFPSLNIQRSFLCFYFIEIFLMHYPPYHVCKNYSTNCTGKKMFKRCQSSDSYIVAVLSMILKVVLCVFLLTYLDFFLDVTSIFPFLIIVGFNWLQWLLWCQFNQNGRCSIII